MGDGFHAWALGEMELLLTETGRKGPDVSILLRVNEKLMVFVS